MADLTTLKAANERRWANMTITPSRLSLVDSVARRLLGQPGYSRYKELSKATGVPANVIAVIHEREASGNFTKSIAQGDPWNQVSVHIPRGRGPFASFEDAAIDALENCAPYAGKWKDWSIGGTLTLLEQYNGLGYANKGRPSPYIWASTDQYVSGKYVSDGVYDPNAVDQQLGCAALLKRMQEIQAATAPSKPLPTPSIPIPGPAPEEKPVNIFARLLAFILSLFRRK